VSVYGFLHRALQIAPLCRATGKLPILWFHMLVRRVTQVYRALSFAWFGGWQAAKPEVVWQSPGAGSCKIADVVPVWKAPGSKADSFILSSELQASKPFVLHSCGAPEEESPLVEGVDLDLGAGVGLTEDGEAAL